MTDKDTVICIYNDNGMPIEEFILKILLYKLVCLYIFLYI